jgi:hypothetical protein
MQKAEISKVQYRVRSKGYGVSKIEEAGVLWPLRIKRIFK